MLFIASLPMSWAVEYTFRYRDSFQRHLTYAVDKWGTSMTRKYHERRKELEKIALISPYVFPPSLEYEDVLIRKMVFIGPLVAYLRIEEAQEKVLFLELWDGRRAHPPRL